MLTKAALILMTKKYIYISNYYYLKWLFFRILWWKEHCLFELESFFNIINILTATSDQFDGSLLIKIINFFKKNFISAAMPLLYLTKQVLMIALLWQYSVNMNICTLYESYLSDESGSCKRSETSR